MKKYIVKRLLQLIPILIGITLLSFILMQASAMDAVDVMEQNTGGAMSEAEKAAAREELGLDKPLPEQYVVWLKGVLTGDMGKSFVSGQPVFTTFVSKLPATIALAVTSLLLTVLIVYSLRNPVGCKTKPFLGLSHPVSEFYREFPAEFFCVSAAHILLFPETRLVSCYGECPGVEEHHSAHVYPGACNGSKIHQAGPGHSAGGIE